VSDLSGITGMAIVRASVDGERDPNRLASLRDPHCKKSKAQIAEHLTGNWRDDHLYNLASALRLFDTFEGEIARYEVELMKKVRELQPPERRDAPPPPHPNAAKEKVIKRRDKHQARTDLYRFAGVDLMHIDGIATNVATTVLTEVGPDIAAFPDESHFVSWLRLSPRTAISGGKPIKKKRNAVGASRIAGALRMAALTLAKSKTALGAYYRRLARRKGHAVAVFATARKLAVLVYRMLRYGEPYVDEGAERYEARYAQRRLDALRDTVKSLGYDLVPQALAGQAPGSVSG